jgi:hypothetical protein
VVFVVEAAALEWGSFFSPSIVGFRVSIIPPVLHTHFSISHQYCIILATDSIIT